MNNILSPDKNTKLLSKYHLSTKLLAPFLILEYVTYKKDAKTTNNCLHVFNVLNIGFHSYVSTSCVITDYIKPKRIVNFVRFSNGGLHFISTFGHLYNTFYKEMKK